MHLLPELKEVVLLVCRCHCVCLTCCTEWTL